jgi:hypothetical protein
MHVPAHGKRWQALPVGLSSTLIAVVSLVRGLWLLLSGRPKTPLRVLCIVAFDTLHVLCHRKWLPTFRLKLLAALLDCGACVNAAFDRKTRGRHELRATVRLLKDAGISGAVADYLRRLGALERGRPMPGGGRWQFQEVSLYREAVVRLSLGMVATAARVNSGLDEAIAATYSGGALNLLFRLVMQCQIIDDVLDYSQDRSAGLPSFLTACTSLGQARELTQRAARGYAEGRRATRAADVFPLRAALFLVSLGAQWVVSLRR